MKCKKCGYTINKSQRYCDNCGQRVDNSIFSQDAIFYLLIIVFAFLLAASFIFDWSNKSIAIFQLLFAILALLIKKNVIDTSVDNMAKILVIVSLLLVFPYTVAIFTNDEYNKSPIHVDKWSSVVLKDMIDEINHDDYSIISNSSNYLYIDVDNYSQSQYQQYLQSCKSRGYIYDVEQDDGMYYGYNEEGYHLQLNYYQYSEALTISLVAPIQYGKLYWPNSTLSDLLPISNCSTGEVRELTDDKVEIFLADISLQGLNEYIDECINSGFDKNMIRTEKSFVAKDENGNLLKISYTGYKQALIEISVVEYEVSLIVTSSSSLLAYYDVEIYVDDQYQTMIETNDSETILINLKEGIHTIEFVCYDDDSIKAAGVFEVKDNSVFQYDIKCSLLSITIGGQNQSETSGIDLSEFLSWYQQSDVNYEYGLVHYGVVNSYYLIDMDENSVIYFTEGSLLVMKGSFTSESENEITINWNHGIWKDKIRYDSENMTVYVTGLFGNEFEYYACDVQDALDTMTAQ